MWGKRRTDRWDTWLDYSLREDEEDRRRIPTTWRSRRGAARTLKNRWERFRGWERANREPSQSGGRRRRETLGFERKREGERERLEEEFEGRAWRTPGEQIMALRERSSRHGFREESSIRDGRARRGEKKQSTGFKLPPRALQRSVHPDFTFFFFPLSF